MIKISFLIISSGLNNSSCRRDLTDDLAEMWKDIFHSVHLKMKKNVDVTIKYLVSIS